MPYQTILNLNFHDCCQKSLKNINDIEVIQKKLAPVIGLGVFGSIFIGQAKGPVNIATTGWSIHQTDFELLRNVVLTTSSGIIGGRAIRNICFDELMFKHPNGGSSEQRKLHLFWTSLYETFS